jgi:hypothetical protein
MKTRPMILRFCSGSLTPASASRKRSTRVDVHQLEVEAPAEHPLDLGALALSQEAVVDEDAREPVAEALCTSTAATDESTPPERPQIACRRRPLASSRDGLVGEEPGVQSGRACHVEEEAP